MARLDRHHLQREVAQIASCIGREFGKALLEHVAEMPADALRFALSQLEDAKLIFAQGPEDDCRYAFKHALVRDAAYESLLKRRREELHARILEALASSPECPAEVLAHHAFGAGLTSRAIELWVRAGKVALSRAAFAETVSHLTQALQLNAGLPDDRHQKEQRIDLLLALGQATIPLRGDSHSTTVEIFSRAQELARSLGDAQRAFWVSTSRWVAYYVRGEHSIAHDIASTMYEQAQREGNDGRLLTALRARGIREMISGAPLAADATFAQAERLAGLVGQQPLERRMAVVQRFAADPEIANQFHVALTHWALGRTNRARALSAAALDAARSMGHVYTLGHALTHAAIVVVVDHDPAMTVACCEEAAELANKHGMEPWRGYGEILNGFALVLKMDIEQAVVLLQAGLARLARTGTGTMVPVHRAVCAWALQKLGRGAEAAASEKQVHHELNYGSERYWRTETFIWIAQYTQLKSTSDGLSAEHFADQGIIEANSQGAIAWELRAATTLGRLWLSRGERAETLESIVPLMARLPQGKHSTLLREAQALLD